MGIVGGTVGFSCLRAIAGRTTTPWFPDEAPAYKNKSKMETLLGPCIWSEIADRDVLDFGCGKGVEAIEMAQRGARRVIGVDLRVAWLRKATARAIDAGVADRCVFTTSWSEPVDVILSLDSFEHFADPAEILDSMYRLLKPDGSIFVSFGPPWFHPLGGHVYSVFPFAHLLFTESALVRWRSTIKGDGARTIAESGLNKMTIRRFRRFVEKSPLRFASFQTVPIRALRFAANAMTREFTTAVVRGRLVPRESASGVVC